MILLFGIIKDMSRTSDVTSDVTDDGDRTSDSAEEGTFIRLFPTMFVIEGEMQKKKLRRA